MTGTNGRTRVRKGIAVLCGVLLGLVIAEGLLRLGGAAYLRARRVAPPAAESAETHCDILCAGDSFTFGIGAGKGESYPDQLEALLSVRGRVRVRNAGVPGRNSSQLARHLADDLARYRPSVLVVLAGRNDRQSLAESNDYLYRRGPVALLARGQALLARTRVYEVARRGGSALRRRLVGEIGDQPIPLPPAAPSALRDYERLLAASERYAAGGRIAEAMEASRTAIARLPADPRARIQLGILYQHGLNELRQAIPVFEAALAVSPDNREALQHLWEIHYRLNERAASRRYLKRYLANSRYGSARYGGLLRYGVPRFDDEGLFLRMLDGNLGEIADACRRRGVRLVLMNYPHPAERPEEARLDEALRVAAARRHIPFVDNRAVFLRLMADGAAPGDYFVEDGHCTGRGYRLMAEGVARALQASGAPGDYSIQERTRQ